MGYQVLTAGKRTEITDLENKVRIAVFEQDKKFSCWHSVLPGNPIPYKGWFCAGKDFHFSNPGCSRCYCYQRDDRFLFFDAAGNGAVSKGSAA